MITIKHLKRTYGNNTPLIDVNAEIHKGDVISVIGPSGAGKSTLLRCINVLDQPTSGQILIDGTDMTDPSADILKIRQKIGMVFQNFNLFAHKMAVENVMMAPMDLLGVKRQEAFDEAVRLLKMVGLGEKIYAYPDELSGGQQQRVAIARCLAMKPEILLFDEPTSALDTAMVGEVQAVIRELSHQGLTIMIVTHDIEFSREIANRIFYMDEGILYEEGTPEEIFDHPKREKTRAFVKRLRMMEYQISSRDFDLYELNAKIEEFARKYYLSERQTKGMELVVEELVINSLISFTTNIFIQIAYYEMDNKIELSFEYGKNFFDPFHNTTGDALSMVLVQNMTKNVKHVYNGKNHLLMELA